MKGVNFMNEYYDPNSQNQQYQQYNQPPYQPPVQQPYYPQYDSTTEVMSVGQYIGMFILSAIPIVNIICWIIWLCSPNTNKNKKNYIIANIVIWAIMIVVSVIFVVLGSVLGISAASML